MLPATEGAGPGRRSGSSLRDEGAVTLRMATSVSGSALCGTADLAGVAADGCEAGRPALALTSVAEGACASVDCW